MIARCSVELTEIHTDPADRMILATAAELGTAVVSRDGRLAQCKVARIVW